jgi:hypothetical protein
MHLRRAAAFALIGPFAASAAWARASEDVSGPPETAAPPAAEESLRRVLRSGCRDGLAEVRAHAQAGDAAAPWASTVARLCDEVLSAPAAAPGATAPPVVDARAPADTPHDGRGVLVIGLALYGIGAGIATDVLFTIDGTRSAIVAPLLGMAAGLGLSLVATGDHPVTSGQAWTIVTGLEYGSLNGALWAGGIDLDAKGVVGTALAAGVAAGSVGVWVASTRSPRMGDVELVRSGLLWGTVAGLLAVASFAPDASSEVVWRTGGAAMDAGLVAGLGLAGTFELSRNRVLLIDAGALGGGLASLGLAWLIAGAPGDHGRLLAGSALGGVCLGLVTAAVLTRDMDRDPSEAAGPSIPALYSRDARDRWSFGMPGPTPLLDRYGQRIIGATFTALGGMF